MTSITQHLGEGANTTISNIPLSGQYTLRGKLTTCVGSKTKNMNIDWFTYKTQYGSTINLCEYCARTAFNEDEVEKSYSVDYTSSLGTRHQDYVRTSGGYGSPMGKICDFASNGHMELYRLGCHRRAMFYRGLRVNVNIIDQSGEQFRPTSLLPGSEMAARNGTGIFQVPSHRYYEICVTGENLQNDADLLLLHDGHFENGKKIKLIDQDGDQYYNNIKSGMVINSFTSGDSSSRFVFVAPSDEEKGAGLQADCHNKSNIINMKIGVYRKVNKQTQFRSIDNTPSMRGQTRGTPSGQYRGAPSGGSTLAGDGTSTTASTHKITPPILMGTIDITIQLVSTQDNSERLHLAQDVQCTVEQKRVDEIENLQKRLLLLQRQAGEDQRSKLTKQNHLLNLT